MTTPAQLFKDISAGNFKPAYYFFGAEDYRIIEAEKFIAHKFLPDLQITTNYRKIDGKRTSVADLIAELSNLPMLGERQFFSVSDFQSYKPKQVASILKMLTPPDLNRIVLLKSPSSKPPTKKSVFFKAVSVAAEAIEFKKLNEREVGGLIASRLQKAGISIQPDALRLMVSLLSGNRGGLEQELKKLIDYKSAGEMIDEEDIEKICSGYEVFNIFELGDAVAAGDTTKAFKMASGLIADGNSPVTLTTLLQQHFTSIFLVKNGKKALGNRNFGFLLTKYRQQGSRFENARLEEIILQIAQTDAELRHMGMRPEVRLESLILQLATPGK